MKTRRVLAVLIVMLSMVATILWMRRRPDRPPDTALTHSVFDALQDNTTRQQIVTVTGPPNFELSGARLPTIIAPPACRAGALKALVYYRKPPASSYYLFLGQDDRLLCKSEGYMLAAY
jgi:hypothetical protein